MTDRPVLEINRPSHQTTINGVPLDRLHDHLPPPIECEDCGYPFVWFLIDPVAQRAGHEGEHGELVMLAEFQVGCVDTALKEQLGALAASPTCGHPYHLVPHADCRPGLGARRLVPAFPVGLIARV